MVVILIGAFGRCVQRVVEVEHNHAHAPAPTQPPNTEGRIAVILEMLLKLERVMMIAARMVHSL